MEETNPKSKVTATGAPPLLCCAAIVLPYLTATELASTSLTCKALHHICKLVTSRRLSDASRTLENLPIPISSPDSSYPYFLYTPTQTPPVSPNLRQSWGEADHKSESARADPFLFRVEGATGCECEKCEGCGCPCLGEGGTGIGLGLGRECGPSCGCGSGCGNRVTQDGLRVGLRIVWDARKGWGLCAAQMISIGQYVCEYAGELLSTEEARLRQETYDKLNCVSPSLLVVKEHLPSINACIRINIDATRIGNVARFINHSCDGGNLDTVIVRSSGALLPRVCLFASREIQENEELTFSYGDVRLRPDGKACFCGSSNCAGTLPSELT